MGSNCNPEKDVNQSQTITVREWDPEEFHRRVHELEAEGYVTCLDSYRVLPEMNPETGEVMHLRMVDMYKTLANHG